MGDPVAWVWGTHLSQLTRSISGEAAAATTRSSGLWRHTAWMSSALASDATSRRVPWMPSTPSSWSGTVSGIRSKPR